MAKGKKAAAKKAVTVTVTAKTNKKPRRGKGAARRSRARKSYKKDKPSRFAIDMINMAYPHDGSPVIRFPDGQGVETMAMNVVTTGILKNKGFSASSVNPAAPTNSLRYPQNAHAVYFFPGSIQHCQFLNAVGVPLSYPLANTEITKLPPTEFVTGDLGDSKPNSLGGNAGSFTSINTFTAYRVTGATLRLTYIGNPDNSAGEICAIKFDPDRVRPRQITTATNVERTIPIKSDDIMHARVERFSASDGVYISFHRSDVSQFSTFKDIWDPLTGGTYQAQNDVASTIAAQASMEAVALFFSGTNPNGELDQSLASWRYELIQTIEFLPKVGTITHRLATESPPNMPLYCSAYDQLFKSLKDRALDIVTASQGEMVRGVAYSVAKAASSETAAKHGSYVPNVSIDGG
jgi:hypothetical protein